MTLASLLIRTRPTLEAGETHTRIAFISPLQFKADERGEVGNNAAEHAELISGI